MNVGGEKLNYMDVSASGKFLAAISSTGKVLVYSLMETEEEIFPESLQPKNIIDDHNTYGLKVKFAPNNW